MPFPPLPSINVPSFYLWQHFISFTSESATIRDRFKIFGSQGDAYKIIRFPSALVREAKVEWTL